MITQLLEKIYFFALGLIITCGIITSLPLIAALLNILRKI